MSIEERISAYIDGELNAADRAEVERLLQTDDTARTLLETMRAADIHARERFSAALEAPVPLALARAVMDAPEPQTAAAAKPAPARSSGTFRQAVAASVLLVMAVGAAGYGGYLTGVQRSETVVAEKRGWLDDIAEYHRVYAAEKRHLVEVRPDEAEHIQAWLGKRTNTPFAVPDLSGRGLSFEGGRLLVASGRPVAQLMYRDRQGAVIALCFTAAGDQPGGATVEFADRNFGDLDMVSWKKSGSSFVVVGPAKNPELKAIAMDISQLI